MIGKAVPLFIGEDQRLAAWYTPGDASSGLARDCAILLCPPVGHEYMCSYRAFRQLAADLASNGFPVLRFDYYGTGDSHGPSGDDSLVPHWKESISLAADELRRLSGCASVAFVGLRVGATLAAAVAAQRDDVKVLGLWSPCTSGRAYVREIRMLAAATSRSEDMVPESEGIESLGFHFNARTAADLNRLKLEDQGAWPVQDVLLLTSDDTPENPGLASAIIARGGGCDTRVYGGRATFMVAPSESVLPTGALDMIVQWLRGKCPAVAASSLKNAKANRARRVSITEREGVRELIVMFTERGSAAAITEPAAVSDAPAIILLNSGAYHHVGPHRLYAPLARRWAALGFAVMRVDLTGIGDSDEDRSRPTSDPYPPAAMDDIDSAMRYLRDVRGHTKVILAGMCSGAYHAVYGAELGADAVIAVNPPLFHHAGDPIVADPHYNNHAETGRVVKALWNPRKWRRLLGGKVDLRYTVNVLARRVYEASRECATAARRVLNVHDVNRRRDPVSLFHDDVPMHFIFNEGDKSEVFFERRLSRQLAHLRESGALTVDIVSGADHTFMPVRWQRVLAELMTGYLMRYRGAAPRPNRATAVPAART